METLIWLRGALVPESEANVSVLSGMAQFGLNVFEGIRAYVDSSNSELNAFRLLDHLDRLERSCKLIGFELPESREQIAANVNSTLIQNKIKSDVALRITVFADGVGSWHTSDQISYFIAPMKKPRTDIFNLTGSKACVSSWTRISDNVLPPRAKVGANYINGRFAHLAAKAGGYDLPILLNQQGKVCEGAGACIFLIAGNSLITPSKTSSILESITRDAVINLAIDQNYKIEERPVDRTEIYLADEVFMCGTAAEITPITSVDQFKIGTGSVGTGTKELLQQYHQLVSGEIEKYSNWLSKIELEEF